MTPYSMEYPFGQFGLAVPGTSPLNLLPTPSLQGFEGGGRGSRESLDAVQALFSNRQNIGALPTPFQPQVQGTELYGLLWRTPFQPNLVQSPPLVPYHLHHVQVPHNLIHLHIFWHPIVLMSHSWNPLLPTLILKPSLYPTHRFIHSH